MTDRPKWTDRHTSPELAMAREAVAKGAMLGFELKQPPSPFDVIDVLVDNPKAAAAAQYSVDPKARARAREELRGEVAEANKPPKPTAAEWRARIKKSIEALPEDDRPGVLSSEWYNGLKSDRSREMVDDVVFELSLPPGATIAPDLADEFPVEEGEFDDDYAGFDYEAFNRGEIDAEGNPVDDEDEVEEIRNFVSDFGILDQN